MLKILILHSTPKNLRTFEMKSNFVKLCLKFEFYYQRADQKQKLEVKSPIPIPFLIPTLISPYQTKPYNFYKGKIRNSISSMIVIDLNTFNIIK